MSRNDKVLLKQIVENEASESGYKNDITSFFELFCVKKIFNNKNLDSDEIESSITDGPDDGGIDAVLVFCNENFLATMDDYEASPPKKISKIEINLLQTKYKDSFEEKPMESILKTVDDMFDLSKNLSEIKKIYNLEVYGKIELIQRLIRDSGASFPHIVVKIGYGTLSEDKPNDKILHIKNKILEQVMEYFGRDQIIVDFSFYDCHDLLKRSRVQENSTFRLKVAENISSDLGGYTCLINIKEFSNILITKEGDLNRKIFEDNVRDYERERGVNLEISKTLREQRNIDFWWLNNGVTIVANKATLNAKDLNIENPQIVNGQQTSIEIHNYFKNSDQSEDIEKRHVLVRVIPGITENIRDLVIKATNSQTAIKPSQLKSTEKIHRDIEDYLSAKGLFYERRKNFYLNQGKFAHQIITLDQFAQVLHSVINQKPHEARHSPKNLVSKSDIYSKIFDEHIDIEIYYKLAQIYYKTREYLRLNSRRMPRVKDISNHIILFQVQKMLNNRSPRISDLRNIDLVAFNDEYIEQTVGEVYKSFSDQKFFDLAIPQLAKTKDSLVILEKINF